MVARGLVNQYPLNSRPRPGQRPSPYGHSSQARKHGRGQGPCQTVTARVPKARVAASRTRLARIVGGMPMNRVGVSYVSGESFKVSDHGPNDAVNVSGISKRRASGAIDGRIDLQVTLTPDGPAALLGDPTPQETSVV